MPIANQTAPAALPAVAPARASTVAPAKLPATARATALAALLALTACATLNTEPPRQFDLTGDWILDQLTSDPPPDLNAIRRQEDRNVARGRQSNPGASAVFVVQDFPVLRATRLRIEQDADSMGIRYDDTTYRDVSWGERERDFWLVRAGFEQGALVIHSKRGAIKGRETLTLEDQGRRLRVAVRVNTGGEDVSAVRVFRRLW